MKTIKNLTADELRKSILQLAIQGKLVKQDPNDEPASELVKRIYEEKNKLIAEGKIKKDKNQSYIFKGDDNCYYEKTGNNDPVKLDDLPFDIPDNWMWIKFGNLVNIQTGASFKKEQVILEHKQDYIRVLRGGNILPFKYLLKNDDLFLKKDLVDNKILLRKYDLITPAVTSLENIGKVATIREDYDNVTVGGFVYIFRPYKILQNISNIIMNFMSSSLFQSLMKAITKKSGQAFYNMNKERLKELYFPLPPLEEQQRIVDKINSFEPLLERYDKVEKELSKLEKEFSEKLKKSILQYAIEGKLVKQDPNDEPASVLLERIKAEKQKLIKEGKIKRDKNESYIYQGDDKNYYEKMGNVEELIETPFEINDQWSWTRLKDISIIQEGAGIRTFQYKESGIQLLTVTNILEGKVDLFKLKKYVSVEEFNQKYLHLQLNKGDIVSSCSGASWGKTAIFDENDVVMLNTSTLRLRFYNDSADNMYLYYLTKTPLFKKQLVNQLSGMQPNFGYAHYSKLLVPLPSLNTQHKIVKLLTRILDQI